jgi:hypothetical protein
MFRRLILLVVALIAVAGMTGCYYSSATFNPKNGKMYVTKNDQILYGIMRKVYECTPAGDSYNCQPMPDAP